MAIAVYPGSFDPVTNGHIDVIERAAGIFDKLLVAVFHNTEKNPLFTMQERVEMLREATYGIPNVTIDCFSGLQVDYARRHRAKVIIRGLRAITDFEYEFMVAQMNKKLAPELETMFIMTNVKYSYISSRIVKEIFSFGGCIDDMVPENVVKALKAKFGGRKIGNRRIVDGGPFQTDREA